MSKRTYNNAGVEDIHLHEGGCAVFWEYDCDCIHSINDNYMMYEDMEPPERVSKSAKPKMGVSGKSVLLLQKLIGRKGKKK